LLARGHPDRGKAILGEQRQQQPRIPPIMLLFACFCSADFRRMTGSPVRELRGTQRRAGRNLKSFNYLTPPKVLRAMV
jgi:hypothetical protein